MTERAYIGLGANLGDAAATVASALDALAALGTVAARSSLYRTAPWGKAEQPDFVNAVAALDTALAPAALLAALQALERRYGRVAGERWGPRALDLDILTYGAVQVDTPTLRIPHPHMRERAFVLVPLAEIDPAWSQARDALESALGVRKLLAADRACDR